MPLIYAIPGEVNVVKRIVGTQDERAKLEEMGFTPGALVTLVTSSGGDVIVCVKESRVAISREVAERILI